MRRLHVWNCNVCGALEYRQEAAGYDFEYETTLEEYHYVQCARCGHIYLSDPPSPDELRAIYPGTYLPYNFDRDLNALARLGRRWVQQRKAAFYRQALAGTASILEVGAGSGLLMEALRDFGPGGWTLTANDFQGHRLERLAGKGISLAIGDFETLEFESEFDCIIINQTLEHFYNPDAVLERCAHLLARGGLLVIETPNHDALDHKLFAGRYWGGYHIPRHFHIYSTASLTQHLQTHGLRVQRLDFLLSPSFWIQSLHHYCMERHPSLSRIFTVNNPAILSFFCGVDFVLARVWQTSNMRIVATPAR